MNKKIKWVVKKAITLTPDEVKECIRTSKGAQGAMQDYLKNSIRGNFSATQVVMAYNSDGELMGWAIVSPNYSKLRCFSGFLHIYVKAKFRKEGVGRALIFKTLSLKVNSKPTVVADSMRGARLYSKFNKRLHIVGPYRAKALECN